jgi:hypothetical protein
MDFNCNDKRHREEFTPGEREIKAMIKTRSLSDYLRDLIRAFIRYLSVSIRGKNYFHFVEYLQLFLFVNTINR